MFEGLRPIGLAFRECWSALDQLAQTLWFFDTCPGTAYDSEDIGAVPNVGVRDVARFG